MVCLVGNEFGNHFRSYHLVTGIMKDSKSSYSSTNANAMFKGDGVELQNVLESSLHARKGV